MSDVTRREVLAMIERLSLLGLLEMVRPVLMRDSEVAELLAQQQVPPGPGSALTSGDSAAPTVHGVAVLMTYLQSNAAQIAQWHHQLSGMVFGVGFGVYGSSVGYQLSIGGSFAVSVDLDHSSAEGGIFGTAALSASSSKGFSVRLGPTFFGGQGRLSGIKGSSTSLEAGPVGVTVNQQLEIASFTPGAAGVSFTTSPANTTVQIAGGSADLAAPFGAFYEWLDALAKHDWFPEEPLSYVPDE